MNCASSGDAEDDSNTESVDSDVSTSTYTDSDQDSKPAPILIQTSGVVGGNPKKRKRSSSQDVIYRSSRPRSSFNNNYLRLLNETITQVNLSVIEGEEQAFSSSQYGISKWSSKEKALFFRGIKRYGRGNLPAITALVATKSEPEVHVYIQLLQEASNKQHLYGESTSLISVADVPAAEEVSQQCCVELEQAADIMSALQQKVEEHREKKRHCEFWRLNQRSADWVKKRFQEGDKGIKRVENELPAAEILKLEAFLKLSRNVFMNSAEPKDNWRSYVSKRDVQRTRYPAIFFTAFQDLHTVAMSITRRLIQSALFFAMSRLRASQSLRHTSKQAVKRCDVSAALDVLGMEHSARQTWVNVARRCKLSIYGKGPKDVLSYDDVEKVLAQTKPRAKSRTLLGSPSLSPDQYPAHGSSNTTAEVPADSTSDQKRNAYLEYIDQRSSRKEELQLWAMLGVQPPQDLIPEEPTQVPKPDFHRHDRGDMDDWRGWVDFQPEWEAYDIEGWDADLANNRKTTAPRLRASNSPLEQRRGRSQYRVNEEDDESSDADQTAMRISSRRGSADGTSSRRHSVQDHVSSEDEESVEEATSSQGSNEDVENDSTKADGRQGYASTDDDDVGEE